MRMRIAKIESYRFINVNETFHFQVFQFDRRGLRNLKMIKYSEINLLEDTVIPLEAQVM